MRPLVEELNERYDEDYEYSAFHVRCIARVINLGVKDFLKIVQESICTIRSLVLAIKASVKSRDLCENLCVELGEKCLRSFFGC